MSFFKVFLVLVLVVAQLGQAGAMQKHQCEHEVTPLAVGENSHQLHDMGMSEDAHHQHMGHSVDESQTSQLATANMDCCGDDCVCPANACSSTLFVATQLQQDEVHFHPLKIALTDSTQLLRQQSSLFRPPIIS
ncbi:hypothetical protein [Thalassotalea sp. Y01]|uniref:hypothetical protein n=1 Tax=Thalassotalea sp. Y01 TaxID=2729613 RepID=UPI00145C4701|nr:hypothetical protein [Thalassotalea sp. Y01]NMP14974.1 hypothetical protein [Thalassotalea sp. Y01]